MRDITIAGLEISLRSDAIRAYYASNEETLDSPQSSASALRETPRPAGL